MISNFAAVGGGDGTGEAGRLDGLKNEGALMACIMEGIEVGCVVLDDAAALVRV